ncbi:LacI family DNA-binding transcriptional regulator [Hahella sp. KA22]|uniref:LacI family DNA-binding transcriptional regulator n=1 Tax=Hahella sp. KA22 TaxID=1628392 RepID=UPI000FDDA051|nr:LacI family DNA-binding transcriptional regulator [Hahella sp. KA22]AZZ95158.1 LacI family DNA-binding transcriptional regulator [Hahella sp. KA22]QAY52803.1 LacI family DNA-binding transcriptional regulator [Hahella sp. KA22]
MITIKEVSDRAKVSISTVSRVINNTAPVKESTRKRVFKAMKDLGYRPNSFAQGLVTNRSNNIGLVVTDLLGVFFGPLISSLERALRESGYNLIISVENYSSDEIKETIDMLAGRRCDAIILFPYCLTDEELIALKEKSPPLVLLNRYVPELAGECVIVDNEQGSHLVVEYLASIGHRRIACISGPLGNEEGRARLSGYRRSLENLGMRYDKDLVVEGDFTVEGGYVATQRLLKRSRDFTAIFACNDQMAAGAMKALREAKLSVPEEISLVGFDDVEYASLLYPALTTVRQPVNAMGKRAAALAIQSIQGERRTQPAPMFEPELVLRDSVAPPKNTSAT